YLPDELIELRHREPDFAKPFDDFLEQLIPDEKDRLFLAKWCATVMACLGVKLTVAVLLTGPVQGVGKSTLGNIMAEVLGWKNVTQMQLSSLLKNDFHDWAEKQLVIINEIQEISDGRQIYDKTQEPISERRGPVNRKYRPKYEAKSFANFFCSTNSGRVLQ